MNMMRSNGLKKNEIATKMGKSNSFVSQHSALLDLPDQLAEAFNSGRVVDVSGSLITLDRDQFAAQLIGHNAIAAIAHQEIAL